MAVDPLHTRKNDLHSTDMSLLVRARRSIVHTKSKFPWEGTLVVSGRIWWILWSCHEQFYSLLLGLYRFIHGNFFTRSWESIVWVWVGLFVIVWPFEQQGEMHAETERVA